MDEEYEIELVSGDGFDEGLAFLVVAVTDARYIQRIIRQSQQGTLRVKIFKVTHERKEV